jgi:hypothetical protein
MVSHRFSLAAYLQRSQAIKIQLKIQSHTDCADLHANKDPQNLRENIQSLIV